MRIALGKGFSTPHKDLKPGMQILTKSGWRIVKSAPASWLAGTLIVHLTNGKHEVAEPDHRWVRRVNTLNSKENRR